MTQIKQLMVMILIMTGIGGCNQWKQLTGAGNSEGFSEPIELTYEDTDINSNETLAGTSESDPAPQLEPGPVVTTTGRTSSPPREPIIHVIRPGDTLWSIAEKTYGDGQRWRSIRRANPGINPQKLHIGDKVMLPDLSEQLAEVPTN